MKLPYFELQRNFAPSVVVTCFFVSEAARNTFWQVALLINLIISGCPIDVSQACDHDGDETDGLRLNAAAVASEGNNDEVNMFCLQKWKNC